MTPCLCHSPKQTLSNVKAVPVRIGARCVLPVVQKVAIASYWPVHHGEGICTRTVDLGYNGLGSPLASTMIDNLLVTIDIRLGRTCVRSGAAEGSDKENNILPKI